MGIIEKNIYKTSAQFYDGGNGRDFTQDIEFYKKYIKPGMKVLDVGCGTGRVTIALSSDDVRITGIDLSDTMLKVFRKKYEMLSDKQKEKIKFYKGDMTDFDLGEKYELILFPFRVFQALTTNAQREKCLACVRDHLAEGGTVIINMFDPDFSLLDNFETLNKIDYSYYDKEYDAEIIRKSVGEGHDRRGRLIKVKYIFEIRSGESAIIEDFIELGYMEKNEAEGFFCKSGYQIENLFSWWDMSEYNEEQKRELIFILK